MVHERIAHEEEVDAYLAKMRVALDQGAQLNIQLIRNVDNNRDERYTNRYTIGDLFPNDDPKVVLKNELKSLCKAEYIRTVDDLRCPSHGEFWEFGRVYPQGDVYIKTRVCCFDSNAAGRHTIFVMSFHYAEVPLSKETFPYA